MWSRIRFGSNVIIGEPVSRTSVSVSGVRLFDVTFHDARLVMSAEVYDAHGRRISVVVRPPRPDVTHRVGVYDADTESALFMGLEYTDGELVVVALDVFVRDRTHCALDRHGYLTIYRHSTSFTQRCGGRTVDSVLDRIDLPNTLTAPSVVGLRSDRHAPVRYNESVTRTRE